MSLLNFVNAPGVPDEPVFRLSVKQYHQMIDAGVLTEDDPVELVEGLLVYKMPKKPPHRHRNQKLAELFRKLLPPGWFYQSQEPITLEDGEPEPDGAVVCGTIDDYAQRHPGPGDIALLIEVADTTISRDRGTKLRSYARAGIAEYWIINTIDQDLEVYRTPNRKTASYEPVVKLSGADSVQLHISGQAVIWLKVAEVLGGEVG